MRARLGHAGLALMLCASSTGAAEAPSSSKKLQPPSRAELFVGNGSAAWLPQTTSLPNAREIDNRAQKLGARQRNLEPFGLRMFPVDEQTPAVSSNIARAADRVTLNQALQTLRITGINLDKREFLIGARNVFIGDALELSFKGEVFLAEVVEVGPVQIVFRDNARQETGVMSHHLVQRFALEPLRSKPRDTALQHLLTPMEPRTNQRP
jgi:hypothetical protein